MRVYVVVSYNYDGAEIEKVFYNPERAAQYALELTKAQENRPQYARDFIDVDIYEVEE